MKKKFFAMLTAAALCVGMLPSAALADVGEPTEDVSTKTVMEISSMGEETEDEAEVSESAEEVITEEADEAVEEETEAVEEETEADGEDVETGGEDEEDAEIALLSAEEEDSGEEDSEDEEDEDEIALLAERTEYPDAGIPEIDDLEWGIERSKSATELNEDYESTVTLQFQHDIDLVIVQDGTNLENETFLFLESLEEQTDVHVNAGLVVFGGTTPISWSSGELLDLSVPANMELLDWALNDGAWDDTAGHSGSNVQAGIREARNMLNSDSTHVSSEKFIIVMSDCAARMWIEGDDLDTAYAQGRYISNTKQMFFDTNEDWIERYGQRISASHNVLGDSSEFLFDYPSFQDVWNAGQGGAYLDNYVMSYPEWLEKEAAGDLTGSISVTKPDEPNVITSEDYYTNYETATYHTALEFISAAREADIHLISFSYYGYPILQYSYGQYMDEFQEWIGELNNVTRHSYSLNSSAIFNSIMEDIESTELGGGVLIDEIGCTDDYDFDFIDEVGRLHLTAAGEAYDCTEIATEKGETSAYGFGDPNGSDDGTTYPFILRYYADGYTYTDEYTGSTETYGECIVLELNTGISKYYNYDAETGTTTSGISLSYDVVLTNPQTASGTYGTYDEYGQNNDGSADYGLYTNNQASLYPKDRDGNPLPKQDFPKPTVSYTVTGVSVDKEWNDGEDADGIRPDSITVELIKNGEATGQTLILSEENGWSGSFSGLRVYPQDAQDDYTVSEVSVEGYTTEISGDARAGYEIINTHTPEEEPEPGPTDETMNIKVTKVWEGDSGDDRPASVEISLLAGSEVSDTVTLDADSGWTYTWSGLPVYDDQDGAIQYKVKEVSVPEGYTVSYGDWQADDSTHSIIVTNTVNAEIVTGSPGGSEPTPTGGTKTGDTDMTYLWILLMIAAAAVVAGVTLKTRPRINK